MENIFDGRDRVLYCWFGGDILKDFNFSRRHFFLILFFEAGGGAGAHGFTRCLIRNTHRAWDIGVLWVVRELGHCAIFIAGNRF